MVTVDPSIGDLPEGELLVRDGAIVDVGTDLADAGVPVVDLTGCVVMPGFVDTHWHLWNSLLRGVIGSGPDRAYFPVKRRLAPLYEPSHSYTASRLALAEALVAGITTVVNWDHNLRSPSHADAELLAHIDSGLRVRLAYGNPDAFDPSVMMDVEDVDRVRRWVMERGDERLDVGVSLRGPTRTDRALMFDEWAFARERGLPITVHVGGRRTDTGRYADLAQMGRDGLLGPDVQLVHAVDADSDDLALLAETDTSLTLSPVTEFKSMDLPPLGPALEAGIRVSLSIDTLAAPTNADMFGVMKLMLRMEQYRDRDSLLDERRMIELATIGGARDLGLDDVTGSLTPGKRADVIAVRVDGPSLSPAVDPISLLVHCAQPADVSLVVADGRILKRDGQVTFFDTAEIAEDARRATVDLLGRASWDVGSSLVRV